MPHLVMGRLRATPSPSHASILDDETAIPLMTDTGVAMSLASMPSSRSPASPEMRRRQHSEWARSEVPFGWAEKSRHAPLCERHSKPRQIRGEALAAKQS